MRSAALVVLIAIVVTTGLAFAQTEGAVPCIPFPECHNTDEPYDYFFVPEQRYAKNPIAIKHLKPGRVVGDRYSSELVTLSLRPVGATVKVPRQYLKQISRPFVRPWALKHWDYVEVEVLLPTFLPRTRTNESLFFDGFSLDVMFVRLGGLTGETVYRNLNNRISRGDHVAVSTDKRFGLSEFKQLERKDKSSVPSYFMPEDPTLKTLSGNPLVIHCLGDWWEGVDDAISCEVNLSIPRALWPLSLHGNFGGVDGVGMTYRFRKKHLAAWRQIHDKALSMADDFLTDVSFALPKPSQQLSK